MPKKKVSSGVAKYYVVDCSDVCSPIVRVFDTLGEVQACIHNEVVSYEDPSDAEGKFHVFHGQKRDIEITRETVVRID